ncbi:hypothetical protein OCS_00008 [Ophiocordyceps sinensis CO18]|uniref:Uncharacterized protein n=1 Tax=Ophiocordyceps sinensis (strain Co18 / CGMCC 3.14243) TaxID=911162 RepID=T5AR09_OPHSC|nr:hypothetical protein OCS_00008 [Ophiocordyceps sinensis CO18]
MDTVYTWCIVTVDAPDCYTCPIFKILLGDKESLERICSATPLAFAPGLLDVLRSSSPPFVDFFRSLPPPPVVERTPLPQNAARHSQQLRPRFVKHAVEQGYAITHRGLLCWTPFPAVGRVPFARVRLVAAEAVFCAIFFAAFETKLDAVWAAFLPWKRETVDWLTLRSHTALMERPPGDHDMTEEQLESYDGERRRHTKDRMAIYGKLHDAKTRANDLEGYLARQRVTKLATLRSRRFVDKHKANKTHLLSCLRLIRHD